MDLGIEGEVALVLGASGGLGGAVARRLAQEGVKVALAGVNQKALAAIKSEVEAIGVECCDLIWPLDDFTLIDTHATNVEKKLGPVTLLFNNTGGPTPSAAQAVSTEDWNQYFQLMVASVIAVTDRFLPGMKEKRFGRILTSTSSGVLSPIPNLAISNSLRLALVGWSKTLAAEVGPDGITANIIIPGRIETARTLSLDQGKARKTEP